MNKAVCFKMLFAKKANSTVQFETRPAWAGFKTAEEGIAIIKSCIL
jgi:hypothetical protein